MGGRARGEIRKFIVFPSCFRLLSRPPTLTPPFGHPSPKIGRGDGGEGACILLRQPLESMAHEFLKRTPLALFPKHLLGRPFG